MRQHILGIIALLAGTAALGLAVIPGIALDQPLPFAREQRPPQPPPPPPEKEQGGVTLKYKKVSVTFGGGKEKKDAEQKPDADPVAQNVAPPAQTAAPEDRARLVKGFTIAAICCSLLGLIFGPIAWAREKQPALSGSAMAICCAAILWQYIVIGIVVGLVIAIVLLVLSALG